MYWGNSGTSKTIRSGPLDSADSPVPLLVLTRWLLLGLSPFPLLLPLGEVLLLLLLLGLLLGLTPSLLPLSVARWPLLLQHTPLS
jgi:hypothetical protein